ncbi:MAG: hypothetical protein WCY37_02355 [Candidatus Dojkabacteria bacterium]|jgi:hypothetical protein
MNKLPQNSKNKNLPIAIFLGTLLMFTISQLVINSILTPLGLELESLNSEKNYLIEENRSMEEEIAKTNSIMVIRQLANKKLNISSDSERVIIYIEDSSVIAERP